MNDDDIERTEKARLRMELSARRIAREIGVAPSSYVRRRKGEFEFDDPKLGALSQLTGIPVSVYLHCRAERKGVARVSVAYLRDSDDFLTALKERASEAGAASVVAEVAKLFELKSEANAAPLESAGGLGNERIAKAYGALSVELEKVAMGFYENFGSDL